MRQKLPVFQVEAHNECPINSTAFALLAAESNFKRPQHEPRSSLVALPPAQRLRLSVDDARTCPH